MPSQHAAQALMDAYLTIDPVRLEPAIWSLDPYLLWQVATNLRAMQGSSENIPDTLTFIAETKGGVGNVLHRSAAPANLSGNHAASSQQLPVWLSFFAFYNRVQSRYVTFRVSTKGDASDGTWFERVKELAQDQNIVRLQLGFSRTPRLGNDLFDSPGHGLQETPPHEATKNAWYLNSKVILGVLDDGCPFAHRAMRHSSDTTRVLALWNQSAYDPQKPPPGGWTLPPNSVFAPNTYGLELTHQAMNAALARHNRAGCVDEEALYTALDMRNAARQRSSHVALVLPLMACAGPDVAARPSTQAEEQSCLTYWGQDQASVAPLIAVQLPRELIRVSSGRWMGVQILDGLRYVMSVVDALYKGAPSPIVVVNISYGAIAGPHDGTGIVEEAMQELTKTLFKDRLAIVLAAGNAHGSARRFDQDQGYLPSGVHSSEKHLDQRPALFTLWVPPEKSRETYLELWFSRRLTEHDKVSVQVECEDQQGIQINVQMDEMKFWSDQSGKTAVGLVALRRPALSKTRSMALLVLAGTEAASDAPIVPSGRWRITVTAEGSPDYSVQAWVERDEVLVGSQRPQSAQLVSDEQDDVAAGLDDTNTLSNIATGAGVFVVGALNAYRGLSPLAPGAPVVSAYSSAMADDKYMDFSAVADTGYARTGIRTGGNLSGMVLRANGTSVAAPQVTRWIANGLANGWTLASLRYALGERPTEPQRSARVGKIIA